MDVPIILALGAIVVVAVVLGIVLTREKDPQRRATALQRTGAAVMAVFTVLAAIFIGGYAMQDPGGNTGLLITLAWVLPMLILAVGPGSGRPRPLPCCSPSRPPSSRRACGSPSTPPPCVNSSARTGR